MNDILAFVYTYRTKPFGYTKIVQFVMKYDASTIIGELGKMISSKFEQSEKILSPMKSKAPKM